MLKERLSFFPWLLEVLIACAILLCEGILHAFWYVFPIWRLQDSLIGKSKRKTGEDVLDYDFAQMAMLHGYRCEEHYVQTDDGYILGMHHVISHVKSSRPVRGVVFFQHGFMQNSEAWIARGPGKCLVYTLVDEGYDVWLGNNRGSKYSYKHVKYSPQDDKFWNFCIDNFAMSDLPAMLTYVLEYTKSPTISYVGFSQGTAQAFAAFSFNHKLASKVNLFVALAPATRVNTLKNPLVAAIATSRPKLIFLLFGKKAMLGETLFWRRVLSHQVYAWVIDFFLDFLFGWKARNIAQHEKSSLYAYLYSYSSVKNLVHWFQITESQNFQAYDEHIQISHPSNYKSYVLPNYQPSLIACPMALFYGGQDSVPEMNWLLKQMPEGTVIHKEESYEHLDFMWAHNAPEAIDKKVLALLHSHNSPPKTEQVEAHSVRV